MPWTIAGIDHTIYRYLEPNPPLNAHGNISLRDLSFYSSELKGIKQIIGLLEKMKGGMALSGDAETTRRYQNTLENLGLININSVNGESSISNAGNIVLQKASAQGVTSESFVPDSHRGLAMEIEKEILANSMSDLLRGVTGKNVDHCVPVCRNVQVLCESLSLVDPERVPQLEDLYWIQLINSSGHEVSRGLRAHGDSLESLMTSIKELAGKAGSKSDFDSAPSSTALEFGIWHYLRQHQKKTLQFDIRFRIDALIKAYLTLRKSDPEFPIIDCNNRPYLPGKIEVDENGKYKRPGPSSTAINLDLPRNLIISGCPGSGKSYFLRQQSEKDSNAIVLRTAFHAETVYIDLIGTYKPHPLYQDSNVPVFDPHSGKKRSQIPVVDYSFSPGPLLEAILFAWENPERNVILIIDEINRANGSAVFGDFLQLLDRDANGVSEYAITPSRDIAAFVRKTTRRPALDSQLRIPRNFFVWGSMNSADKSVRPLDSAFRRRWNFKHMGHGESCVYDTEGVKYGATTRSWGDLRKSINARLVSLDVDEDRLIGPYFLAKEALSSPNEFLDKLLLYLWDDAARFCRGDLFSVKSFSQLGDQWNDGNGSPLNGVA